MAELVREVHIKASPEVIFEYLTDPAKYAEWGGTDAVLEPRPGGTFRVLMGGTHQSAGQYLEVEILLLPDEDGTTVRLTHSGLPADAVDDHTGGWDHYLDRLSIVATGGDAGPDGLPGSAPDV
jgi:uncharacterized protein YndB with AHSA1/START domain